MRHLKVPNREVEAALEFLRGMDWLAPGMRVFSHEGNHHRMIPLDPAAPIEMPEPYDRIEITLHDGAPDDRVDSDWWNHLSLLVDQKEIDGHREDWPSSHEFISDMMIVRIEGKLDGRKSEIAEAKLRAHPHIRVVLMDEGVQGEFRIRKLTPIGARVGQEIVTDQIPETICTTRVTVRESGRSISCDPNKAYYSTKLQSERIETLNFAKELRDLLSRPIRVCDPFCGVGPALSTLLSEKNLVCDALASDLNPDAVDLLLENLGRWDRREYPADPAPIDRLFEDRVVGVADATKLGTNPDFSGRWDLLLVNLPHRTVEMLPGLIPLLDRTSPSLVRGRVIAEENEIHQANLDIRQALPPILEGKEDPSLSIKRDYSSSLRLCSFEAWIAPH